MWMMFGNTYYAVCQWLVLIVIARFGGPSEVGEFALALSLITPVMMFFNLGMRTILASDVAHEHGISNYVLFRVATAALGFLVCIAIAATYGGQTFWIIAAVGASKTVETLTDLCYGFNQRGMRLDRISKSLMMRGTLSTIALAIVYNQTSSLYLALLCYTASWISVLLIFDRHAINEKLKFDRVQFNADLKLFLRNGVPLGIAALMVNLSPNIPRYVLQHDAGNAELGLFSGMAYFITVGTVIITAVGQSLVPILARFYSEGNYRAYYRYLILALIFAFGTGALGVVATLLIGEPVLKLFYGTEFARHADLFPLFAVAATVAYIGNILGFAISSAKIFVGQALAFTVSVLVSLIASHMLIPHYGTAGAAYTLILTSVSNSVVPTILLALSVSRNSRKASLPR
ncbi:oligosaccharide flippase family protein [Rhizobium sp. FY34]|uniref:oligosaccharide flippase family protein n=1 Tax=Rhizobium sp. FY34 TaxID=2562309 RepID=UPI00148535C5|nr:oligosaccharide flippase family protein [Rhizobium sp. FY34]